MADLLDPAYVIMTSSNNGLFSRSLLLIRRRPETHLLMKVFKASRREEH